jgi:hypothetical protein
MLDKQWKWKVKKMIKVYTSTINYSGEDGLDITVKSSGEMGRMFAPTWDMVLDHKNGLITDKEYTKKYYSLMRESYKNYIPKWMKILHKDKVVFLC